MTIFLIHNLLKNIQLIFFKCVYLIHLILFYLIFYAASSDGIARLWNASTGIVEREYQGHQKAVTALAFRDEIVSAS